MTKTKTPFNPVLSSSSSGSPDIAGTSLLRDRWTKPRAILPFVEAPESSKTQQQFKDECDMNLIVKNAQRGIPPKYLARGTPRYGDFSDIPDLATAYTQIKAAEEAFASLPAALRAELGNDPSRIDELTEDQARRYKLLKAEKLEVPPAPPTPSPAEPAPKAPKEPKPE